MFKYFVLLLFLLGGRFAYADVNWLSITLDNDFFVNEDNGYTNGFFASLYDVKDSQQESTQSTPFWVKPLSWSMPDESPLKSVNVYSVGQTLMTPYDIEDATPAEGTFPYSALLSFTNTYIAEAPGYADRVSTTLGVVGPIAMGEQTQKAVHRVISAKMPQGWDTQLENELVFELSRGRTWRSWVASNQHADLLTGADISIGTLRSSVSTGFMVRYGRHLESSFATVLLSESRTSNPIAVDQGWFIYAGVELTMIGNQIFTDGNTFRDSRSIDYDHNYNMFSSGVTYAWQDMSLAFAINAPFSFTEDSQNNDLDKFTRYGTLTFAWKI
ncbi:lipid A deacylase LpxR family protein [Marinomonas vulgaris]|uniref:lipid A deacylase LpxR family protein n=1 Tax=Marinomonas vulgaris TaxID=2823372 RepID=UPI002E2D4819|nr:lipid A deacylase LpxR family protein [Marinomonas vulgaris]